MANFIGNVWYMVAFYRVTIIREAIRYSKTLLKSDATSEQGQVAGVFHFQTLEMKKTPKTRDLQTPSNVKSVVIAFLF